MKTAVLVIGFVLVSAITGFAQSRTVTNLDLEKYQKSRLIAEREYRENYQRLGLPSPEELDKRREEDMKARLEPADQLRQARLEKERLELEQRSIELDAATPSAPTEFDQSDGYYPAFVGGVGFSSGRRHGRVRGRQLNRRGGYRATPFGVIPVPRQPRPQRMIIRSGRRR